jgi:hypothetical protein
VGCDLYIDDMIGAIPTWSGIGNGIPVATTSGFQYDFCMIDGGIGTALITWRDGIPPNCDIYAQKMAAGFPAFQAWGVMGIPVCVAISDQVFPQACTDGNLGMLIAWEDRRDIATPSYDIYGEYLDTKGMVLSGGIPGSGIAICTFTGNQSDPMLCNNQPGEAIYVWRDTRNGAGMTLDLYTLDPLDDTLPVELSSFTATITATNTVQLKWVTQSETNISGFYLQRNSIGNLSGASSISGLIQGTNTSQQTSYYFTDGDVMAGNTYYYWLQSVELDGHSDFYGPVYLTLPDNGDINGTPEIPLATGINGIYPNPFNPFTTVSIGVKDAARVRVEVFNNRGQKVRDLFEGYLEYGTYRCFWNGKTNVGAQCPSGVYLIRMTAGNRTDLKKAVLSK